LPRKPDEPRPWLCPNGHLLGHAERDRSGLKLILYGESIDPRWPRNQPEPVYRGTIRGDAVIRCTICHLDREWHPDAEAMNRLAEKVKDFRKPLKPEHAGCLLTEPG